MLVPQKQQRWVIRPSPVRAGSQVTTSLVRMGLEISASPSFPGRVSILRRRWPHMTALLFSVNGVYQSSSCVCVCIVKAAA